MVWVVSVDFAMSGQRPLYLR